MKLKEVEHQWLLDVVKPEFVLLVLETETMEIGSSKKRTLQIYGERRREREKQIKKCVADEQCIGIFTVALFIYVWCTVVLPKLLRSSFLTFPLYFASNLHMEKLLLLLLDLLVGYKCKQTLDMGGPRISLSRLFHIRVIPQTNSPLEYCPKMVQFM